MFTFIKKVGGAVVTSSLRATVKRDKLPSGAASRLYKNFTQYNQSFFGLGLTEDTLQIGTLIGSGHPKKGSFTVFNVAGLSDTPLVYKQPIKKPAYKNPDAAGRNAYRTANLLDVIETSGLTNTVQHRGFVKGKTGIGLLQTKIPEGHTVLDLSTPQSVLQINTPEATRLKQMAQNRLDEIENKAGIALYKDDIILPYGQHPLGLHNLAIPTDAKGQFKVSSPQSLFIFDIGNPTVKNATNDIPKGTFNPVIPARHIKLKSDIL